jgi:hypothetical protein
MSFYAHLTPAVLRSACFSHPLWQICTMLRHLRCFHQLTTGPNLLPRSILPLRSGDGADPEQSTALGAVVLFGSAALTTSAGAVAEMVASFDYAAVAFAGADAEELTGVDAGALVGAVVGPHFVDRAEALPFVTSCMECTCYLSFRCPIRQ